MKRTYKYIGILLGAIIVLISCNDEWKDELYTNLVSFKAPINYEDVSRIYVRYDKNGVIKYDLPVLISGSLTNKRNFDVKIAVDNDTLDILNKAKYTSRTDLYYKQLENKYFEFDSICKMRSGSSIELFPITFKFDGLDLVEKWVLPLTILESSDYAMNMHKGWRKALLYINLFNDYSGRYSATGMDVYFDEGEKKNPTNAGNREARVVDDNTVFFYAGLTEELAEERGVYKIIARFNPADEDNSTEKLINKKGMLTVEAEDSSILFELLEPARYVIEESMDDQKPHIKNRYITMYIKYKYKDITSASVVLPYHCEGTMVHKRAIDLRIPDEDQAIVW